jgi:predicted DNA-binding ribbon-helix-helix protein
LADKFFFALTSIGLRINLSSGSLPVRIEEDHKGNREKTSCYLRIQSVSFGKKADRAKVLLQSEY